MSRIIRKKVAPCCVKRESSQTGFEPITRQHMVNICARLPENTALFTLLAQNVSERTIYANF